MKTKLLFFLLVTGLVSCNRNPLKVDISNVNVDLKISHLDVDLLKLNPDRLEDEVPELKKRYGDFFDIFTYRMIGIGGDDHPEFYPELKSFISDTMIRNVANVVYEKVDTVLFREELTNAFRHYRYYFPEKPVPEIYTCISGFNQSVVIADRLAGVSLDKYLGAKSPFYERLGLPAYKQRNMIQERIAPEVMHAWALSEWPKSDGVNTLMSHMIQGGKMMYFIDAMFPELNDTLKIGFTKQQLDFCRKNEARMWTYLAEHKELFTTDRMNIKRFIDDGPYTAVFSEKSPGRSAVWIGWQIVRSYMKQNPQVTLADLMANQDYQKILNESGYQP